jgi:uncharacterized membrane protein
MLPWAHRLYFWGVHGIFAEVIFTGLWEFVISGDWRLKGVSSIWSFLVYGLGTFLLAESGRGYLVSLKVPLLLRCCIYVVLTYVWEFSCGMLLDMFEARSWDYSQFTYNIKGLITMEYIPVWFFAGLYFEWIMSVWRTVERVPRWREKLE